MRKRRDMIQHNLSRWQRTAICLVLIIMTGCRLERPPAPLPPPIPLERFILKVSDFEPLWNQSTPYQNDEERGTAAAAILGQFRSPGAGDVLVTHNIYYNPSPATVDNQTAESTGSSVYAYPPNHAQDARVTCYRSSGSSPSSGPMLFCVAAAQYGVYIINFTSYIDDEYRTYAHYQQMLQRIDQKMTTAIQS